MRPRPGDTFVSVAPSREKRNNFELTMIQVIDIADKTVWYERRSQIFKSSLPSKGDEFVTITTTSGGGVLGIGSFLAMLPINSIRINKE